jgi:Hint domain
MLDHMARRNGTALVTCQRHFSGLTTPQPDGQCFLRVHLGLIMPQSLTDQFFLMDPANPLPVGTLLNFSRLVLTDQNDDDDFDNADNDSVNGSDITASYPGDTVTINVPGVGNVTYTGITFYLANGTQVFTPIDGQVLANGTLVSTTFVQPEGPLLISQVGPACFTPGTMIRVPSGAVAIETLKPGDLVETMDHGPQVLRWIGSQPMCGLRAHAPVVISEGALGNVRTLVVSPEHRMLVTNWFAELHFGEAEVLVAARHLTGIPGIAVKPVETVTYIHLLFDRHEIIFAENVPTESFHPGSWMLDGESDLRDEVLAIFPQLADLPDAVRKRPARRVTTGREAQLLVASVAA